MELPQWLCGKESASSAGVAGGAGSIPELGRSPGEEHGNPLHYSCLENPVDRGARQATGHGFIKELESPCWYLVSWFPVKTKRSLIQMKEHI